MADGSSPDSLLVLQEGKHVKFLYWRQSLSTIKITTQRTGLTIRFLWITCAPSPPSPRPIRHDKMDIGECNVWRYPYNGLASHQGKSRNSPQSVSHPYLPVRRIKCSNYTNLNLK